MPTQPVPAAEGAEFDDQVAPGEQGGGRKKQLILTAVGVVTVLALIGAGGFYYLNRGPSPSELALQTAATSSEDMLIDLQAATTTADIRAAVEPAAESAEAVSAAIAADPSDSAAKQALLAQESLLLAMASLVNLNADTLATWAETEATMVAALDELAAAEGLPVAELDENGAPAVRTVSEVVADGQAAMTAWQAQVAQVQAQTAANQAAVAALDAYIPAVQGVLGRYASLRNQTGSFTARVRNGGVTYAQAYQAMSNGASARRALRSELASMTVPEGLAAEHNRLVAMIQSAAEAMDAGYNGIEDSDYCYTTCDYDETSGWRQFQSESDRITGEFGDAEAAWTAKADQIRANAGEVAAPPKPEV